MQKNLLDHNSNSKNWDFIKAFIVIILIFAITVFVYLTGGTDTAFPHIMYIPIILAAYYFGTIGAVGAALLGGFALGPAMPENALLELAQQPAGWIFRLTMFVTIGIICSLLFKRMEDYKNKEIERSYTNFLTGLPNMNKLMLDLDELILDNKKEFSLIGFRIENINSIRQNISYEMGSRSIKEASKVLSRLVNGAVYSIHSNEFVVIFPGGGIENAQAIGEQFLKIAEESIVIDQLHIGLLIKGGIVKFPQSAENSQDLVRKLSMALGQPTEAIGLYVFDDTMEQQSKRRAELIPHLLNAIENEEIYLVYQPKESLDGASTKSVEALLRWNNRTRGEISPGEFIELAEEIGFIGELTKWVIKNVIDQKEKWKNAGMPVKIALNISPKDLNNQSVIDLFTEITENKDLDLSLLEVEITERGILKNNEITMLYFNNLRKQGIKIALDDFGTGYNSMINFVQFPMDYIKIDKTFIDNIMDNTYKLVIKYTIDSAHQLGRKVIAEGVERKEQLDVLKDMGCDYIQGYYLSKPLRPDELRDFYLTEVNH